jgi:hypothetical protein
MHTGGTRFCAVPSCECKGYLPQGGAEEPEPCVALDTVNTWPRLRYCQRDADHEGPHRWADGDDHYEWETEPEAASPPRPPYAVTYSVGGQLFQAWLPGDATAVAEDGVLKIAHAGQVAGIVRVSPVKEG